MAKHAMEMVLVALAMARRAHCRPNAFPIIAWTACVATMRARARAKRVPLQRKAVETMAFAATLRMRLTPTTNAVLVNAMAPVLATKRKRRWRMGPRAFLQRNARLAIASTLSVAIRRVRAHARRVRLRKKAAESTERAGTSSKAPTLIVNAPMALVLARARVNPTMVCHVRSRRSVCQANASTAFVVTMRAVVRARRVRLPIRAAEAMAYVVSLRAARIQTIPAVWSAALSERASKGPWA